MPKVIDQRTGNYLCSLSEEEGAQLMTLLEETMRDDQDAPPVGRDAVERLEEAGVSDRVMVVMQQVIEGRGDLSVRLEPDFP